ncbi:hypothetical protein FFF34_011080 [Inquilinus sp. KBS0705]|nr:hypothetical protein FFF34_011080 [Inquilinus sp. KBS0705]
MIKPVRAYYAVALIFAFQLFTSCHKTASDPLPVADTTHTPLSISKPVVKITSVSITEGGFNTTVTINGSGFVSSLTGNQVYFNNKKALILYANETRIIACVPLGAGTGKITLAVGATKVTGPTFKYLITDVLTFFAGGYTMGFKDGQGSNAKFHSPAGLAIDAVGNIFVADAGNNVIRKITPSGYVSTFAGTGKSGLTNGHKSTATFSTPLGLCFDKAGNLYVSDSDNGVIRKISRNNMVTTFATNGITKFNMPKGITTDVAGNVYVADMQNSIIRKITPQGVVTPYAPAENTPSNNLIFIQPSGLTSDKLGNLYTVQLSNGLIRKITPGRVVTNIAGGATLDGYTDVFNGTGIAAIFYHPESIALSPDGNLYVADTFDRAIRKVTPEGVVTTLLGGLRATSAPHEGSGNNAGMYTPVGIAINAAGVIYVADQTYGFIYKISKQ